MSSVKERYKWDGRCPDCKSVVHIGTFGDNRALYKRVEIDCPNCSYIATGFVRSTKKLNWMQKFYKRPEKYIWSETISPLEHASRDMKWWAERLNDMTLEMELGHIETVRGTLEFLEKVE